MQPRRQPYAVRRLPVSISCQCVAPLTLSPKMGCAVRQGSVISIRPPHLPFAVHLLPSKHQGSSKHVASSSAISLPPCTSGDQHGPELPLANKMLLPSMVLSSDATACLALSPANPVLAPRVCRSTDELTTTSSHHCSPSIPRLPQRDWFRKQGVHCHDRPPSTHTRSRLGIA